jgi:hypothetical protein
MNCSDTKCYQLAAEERDQDRIREELDRERQVGKEERFFSIERIV